MVGITELAEQISFKYAGTDEMEDLLTYKEDVVFRCIAIEGMTIEQVADKTRTPVAEINNIYDTIINKLEDNFELEGK